ncbi:MAG: hypothetical protein MI919_02410, partial [Holophagales bacterium]|nr:hypothetical protein [Holophagales bacterium]
EQIAAAPNRFRTSYSVPGLGDQLEGYDGEVAWKLEGGVHPRIVEGRELQDLLVAAQLHPELTYAEHYPVRETVEKTERSGKECFEVRLVTAHGDETMLCFDTATGLLWAKETWNGPPDTGFAVIELYSDYEEVDGRLLAKTLTQEFTGIRQVITITEIETNTVEDGDLRPPEEILALRAEGGS